jgi:hypothetical protein
MSEVEFTHRGERLRLTRQQVINALRDQTPQPIHTWWVEVEGRRFPVRQVLACATGIPQQDVRVETAMIWLERLGFRIVHVRPTMNRPFTQQAAIDHAAAAAMEHRVAALAAAVQLVAGRPDTGIEDVLEAAETFDAWLTR